MAATIQFVVGPSRNATLPVLLGEYRKVASESIGSSMWIAPARRSVGELRSLLLSAELLSIVQPNVFDLPTLAEETVRYHQPTLRPLTIAQRRVFLREVIEEVRAEGSLSYFEKIAESRGFAEGALGFLDEVKSLGIDVDRFYSTCESQEETSSAKLLACCRLYEHYQEKLNQGKWLDFQELLVRATVLIERGNGEPFTDVKSIVVDGFTQFSPIESAFLKALSTHVDHLWLGRIEIAGSNPMFDVLDRPYAMIAEPFGAGTLQRVVDKTRPEGLAILRENLFHATPKPIARTDGILLVEAPGEVGEARLIAREIRSKLDAGIAPESILVTARDLTSSRDLLQEVFGEYGIPTDVEGAGTLNRNPAVATLLRAARLPEDDWPFAAVTALLRSNYFNPNWQDCIDQPGIAQRAESLLRMLGEPRGREAYLNAVRIWAETPPESLEDEQAEEPRRLRKIRLAGACQSFLQSFFGAWKRMPTRANLQKYSLWLRQFAADIGLVQAASKSAKDQQALNRLWVELETWVSRQQESKLSGSMQRSGFLGLLGTLAASPLQARTPRSAGRVRILSAEVARSLSADYLFVIGLGEGSFPQLASPHSLLDDADRQLLQKQGLAFPPSADRLAWERVLFHELVALPRKELILSFPSMDEKGQSLLPSSFLRAVRDCFIPETIPTIRQRMLIEGYLSREPLSPAEKRVQFAAAQRDRKPEVSAWNDPSLPEDLVAHLRAASRMAQLRFQTQTFNEYDGWMSDPSILGELAQRFGAEKIFSPTALETYIACPFRFYLDTVLHLEPLEEPTEEIEHTRRGSAFHRALARFHDKLLKRTAEFLAPAAMPPEVGEELLAQLDRAIKEYVDRAPSPASKVLWQLEGIRLRRSASRYTAHWEKFVDPWRKVQAIPLPVYLEADFGFRPGEEKAASLEVAPALTIQIGEIEVQVGGRIDRVDAATIADEVGFWIIDYKTGRATNYTASDLKHFEKLQLSLYALAVERVFFAGQKARPLGLAYWLVTDTGPKPVLPGPGKYQIASWLNDRSKWDQFRSQLETWVVTLVARIRQGRFPLAPRSEKCTETCHFAEVCRIGQSRSTGKVWNLHLPTRENEEKSS